MIERITVLAILVQQKEVVMSILKGFVFSLVGLALFGTLMADVIYEQNMTTSLPMTGETEVKSTVYLKGDKEKTESVSMMKVPIPGMDQSHEIVTIVIARLDKELMWILDESARTYTEIHFSTVKDMMEEVKELVPEEQEEEAEMPLKVEVTRLREKEEMEGYSCERVRITMSFEDKQEGKAFDMTANLWMAEEKGPLKEIADFHRTMEELATGSEGMMEGMSGMVPGGMKAMAKYEEKLKDLDGFPIVSEITVSAEGEEQPLMRMETRIENIRSTQLKNSEFEIPEGFEKLEGSLNPMQGD
nr:MAG: hypothetical protein AM324_00960 [Candidatus Thorarchaeota archaeon SMTZ1-83]